MTHKTWIWLLFASSLGVAQDANIIKRGVNWQIGNAKSLRSGAELRGSTNAAGLVLDCDRVGPVEYTCPGGCITTVCSVKEPVSRPLFQLATIASPGLVGLIAKVFSRQSADLVLLAAPRVGGQPNEAVVLLDEKGIHWGPALNRVLEGSYCFRIQSGGSGPVRSFLIEWDRDLDREGPVKVPGLDPGEYILTKGKSAGAACEVETGNAPARILILASKEFLVANRDWEQVTSWLSTLEATGSTPDTVSGLRIAALNAIASQQGLN